MLQHILMKLVSWRFQSKLSSFLASHNWIWLMEEVLFKFDLCLSKIIVMKLVKQIYIDRLWTCFVIIKKPKIV